MTVPHDRTTPAVPVLGIKCVAESETKMSPLGFAPRLSPPQGEVLLLDYGDKRCVHRDSNPNLNLGRVKYYPCTMNARHGRDAPWSTLFRKR